jgi:copper homeostasis protein
MLVEAAVETLDGAIRAEREGAGRLEVCGDLARGGTTPGPGLLRAIRAAVEIPLMVMIRPRPGPFQFSLGECEAMLADIAHARRAGADGVVIGVLTPGGEIDREWTRRLVESASPLPVTFHRAFDLTPDFAGSLELLTGLSVARILTSGGGATAMEGRDGLRRLVQLSRGRIGVLPGGGIRAANAGAIALAAAAGELHVGFPIDAPPGRIAEVVAALTSSI